MHEPLQKKLADDPAFSAEFRSLKSVGRGAFGHVFRAEWHRRASDGSESKTFPVAIKCFSSDANTDASSTSPESWNPTLRNSVHEIDNCLRASERSPYIAKFLALRFRPVPMMVCEWAGDKSVEDLLPSDAHEADWLEANDRSFNDVIRQMLEVGIQVASGLVDAHREEILHLDIKPKNIALQGNGNLKAGHCRLVDFGVARSRVRSFDRRFMVHGHTVYYRAPEREVGPAGDSGAADIYSLGVVLLQLILQESAEVVDARIQGRAKPDLRTKLESIEADEALIELLLRCVDPCPEGRPSASEVAERCKGIYSAYAGKSWIDIEPKETYDRTRDREFAFAYLESVREVEASLRGHRSSETLFPDHMGRRAAIRSFSDKFLRKLESALVIDPDGPTTRRAGGYIYLAMLFAADRRHSVEVPFSAALARADAEAKKILCLDDRQWVAVQDESGVRSMIPVPIGFREQFFDSSRWGALRSMLHRWGNALEAELHRGISSPLSPLLLGLDSGHWDFRWQSRLSVQCTVARSGAEIFTALHFAPSIDADGLFATSKVLLSAVGLWQPEQMHRVARETNPDVSNTRLAYEANISRHSKALDEVGR